jgi:hypothetical protein
VAQSLRRIRDSVTVLAETISKLSDRPPDRILWLDTVAGNVPTERLG